jgi:homoserine O-succinyltransferase
MDGIPRQRLSEKLFGVFESETVAEHYLTSGLPGRHWMPHSRWNGLAEEALTARGYRILTRAEDAGVDTFIRKGQSQFVFFQGHPEYEAATLLREYRRDIRRFLRREIEAYPAAPRSYFDENCAALLDGMKRKAELNREEEALADFPSAALASTLSNRWRSSAVSVYRNWLCYLSAQKYQRLRAPYVAEAALRESA